jgi:hypothetical protein
MRDKVVIPLDDLRLVEMVVEVCILEIVINLV